MLEASFNHRLFLRCASFVTRCILQRREEGEKEKMEDSFAIIEQSTFWKCLAAKELEGKRMLNQCRGIKCARFVRGT